MTDDPPDVFEPVLEHEEAFETVGENRDDRFGALARYFLSMARGEAPDGYEAELAGLPKVGGD